MEKLLYSHVQVAEILSLGRSKTYELISSGQLRSIRIGRSIRVPASALREFVQRQEAAQEGEGQR